MARDLRRQLDSAQGFASATSRSFDLPTDAIYKQIELDLAIRVDTGVGGSATAEFERAPWTLIKRIDLVADGKDTIKGYSGGMLLDINHLDFHAYPWVGELSIPGASANTGTLHLALVISLEQVGMQFPQHTWLDARKLSSLELRLTFGTFAATAPNDIYSAGTVQTLTQYDVTPYGHEIFDIDPASQFGVNQEVMSPSAFPTNTATDRRFKLNVGNAYRRVVLSEVDQNSRAAVNRLLKIRLEQQGSYTRRLWDAGHLKNVNTRLKQLDVGMGVGSAPAALHVVQTTGRNGGSRLGLYELEIAEDGSEKALLDTFGMTDLSLMLDWDGANTTDLLNICPSVIIPSIR